MIKQICIKQTSNLYEANDFGHEKHKQITIGMNFLQIIPIQGARGDVGLKIPVVNKCGVFTKDGPPRPFT